ncbi:MAG: hypothetical protein ACK55I_01920 [bacterium]|jgi:hypothetical protein
MVLNIGGKFDGGYGEIKPGYENPFGKNGPSLKENYDWSGASKGIDWGGKFSIDKDDLYGKLFDKSKQTDKYRTMAEEESSPRRKSFAWGGDWSKGYGGQVLENLSVYEPQKMSPIFLEGAQGSPGFLGGGGGQALAGIAGLALAPMTGGASLAFAPMVGQGLSAAGRTWNI